MSVAARDTSPSPLLDQGLAELGLELDSNARRKLLEFVAQLERWNRVYNLTSIRGAEKIVSVHLLDSLSIVPHVSARRALDVGSGGGLPGIPLAIAQPETEVTLLDSSQKKTAFLRQVVGELALAKARVVCARVESWQTEDRFDLIVSRAFSELGEFAAKSRHLLADGGVLAAMKGMRPVQEISALPQDIRVRDVKSLEVPGLGAERHLVLMERA